MFIPPRQSPPPWRQLPPHLSSPIHSHHLLPSPTPPPQHSPHITSSVCGGGDGGGGGGGDGGLEVELSGDDRGGGVIDAAAVLGCSATFPHSAGMTYL